MIKICSKKAFVVMLSFSIVMANGMTANAKTATYKNKTVTYKYEMGTVPYGATDYLEVCKAKMSYPTSIHLKIKGTITGKKSKKTSTVTYTETTTSTSCVNNLAFDVPGYDITHFKGVYTINKDKSYTIDKDIN